MTIVRGKDTELAYAVKNGVPRWDRIGGMSIQTYEEHMAWNDRVLRMENGEEVDDDIFTKSSEELNIMLRNESQYSYVESERTRRIMDWEQEQINIDKSKEHFLHLFGMKREVCSVCPSAGVAKDKVSLFNELFAEKPELFTINYFSDSDYGLCYIPVKRLGRELPVFQYVNSGVIIAIPAHKTTAHIESSIVRGDPSRTSKRKEKEATKHVGLVPNIDTVILDRDLTEKAVAQTATFLREKGLNGLGSRVQNLKPGQRVGLGISNTGIFTV